jgi:hypothetical protein
MRKAWPGRWWRVRGLGFAAAKVTRRDRRVVLQCRELEDRVVLDDNTTGPNGIDSRGLGLNGNNVRIGQVETGRPGLATRNGAAFDGTYHNHVTPTDVFLRGGAAVANMDVAQHATEVAGVMIADGPANKGVVPAASLYSAAYRTGGNGAGAFEDALLAMQQVSVATASGIAFTNMSWTKFPRAGEGGLNGNSVLSRGLDYLAAQQGNLFIIAPGNDGDTKQVPADAYNGLVVGGTTTVGAVYRKVDTPATLGAGGRRLVDVIAPGDPVRVPRPAAGGSVAYAADGGSSLAAPHATGVAAQIQFDRAVTGGDVDVLRHQVMKAILMNSAEKVSGRIGMGRTVLKQNNTTWDQSDARDDPGNPAGRAIPLDDEMGTGFLNASRAVTQWRGGRFGPQQANTGPIGWDYNTVPAMAGLTPGNLKYTLPTLKGGGWISATLTWDRVATLNDNPGGTPNRYDVGETFNADPVADLDLYLMPAGETDLSKNVWSSTSTLYNLEHIFFQLPAGDKQYELWVRNYSGVATPFGLAWWAERGMEGPVKIGDKVWDDTNANGIQDANEPGHRNVQVDLYDAFTDQIVATRYTDYYGNYEFDVPGGDYYVIFHRPFGYTFTTQHAGNDPAKDSDAGPNGWSDIVITSSDDLTIDAGLVPIPETASVGDRVWRDVVANGVQDPGEPGVPGVTVSLFTAAGDFVAQTVTDANGGYQFTGLPAGDYYAVFSAGPHDVFTAEDAGPDDVDSDADAYGQTEPFTLTEGQSRTDIDAGLLVPTVGSIGDYVWDDTNHNGIQDEGEDGLDGVAVGLYTSAGVLVASTTTDQDGHYGFEDVPPGDYYLVFTAPSGYQFTLQNAGPDNVDSDADGSGRTGVFTLAAGQDLSDWDAGLYASGGSGGSIGDYVWNDVDADGVQDPGEFGLAGVTVNLLDGSGNLLASTTSDAFGHYSFSGLAAGIYQVQFVAPPGYSFSPPHATTDDLDSDANPPTGLTGAFILYANDQRTDIDAGLHGSGGSGGSGGWIGHYAWADPDPNVVQDTSASGNLLASKSSDPFGYASFAGLGSGTYRVDVVAPPGSAPTTPLAVGEPRWGIDVGLEGSGGSPVGSVAALGPDPEGTTPPDTATGRAEPDPSAGGAVIHTPAPLERASILSQVGDPEVRGEHSRYGIYVGDTEWAGSEDPILV